MTTPSPDVLAVLATLRARWGAAAPRRYGETAGALATVPLPAENDPLVAGPAREVVSSGFPALDAILGPGGLPRSASVTLRGDPSSGRTTLALRLAAEAQTAGSIVAWLDLAGAFDPVEAVARGIRLEWLVVLTPGTLADGLSLAGALLSARTVDLLIIDLPPRLDASVRRAAFEDRLHRLVALARRAETLLVVLEPPGLSPAVAHAVAEATGMRLELARRSWIRLGRDVVGQRTEVTVARNRFGPPGRRAELRILYAEGGERDACLLQDGLLAEPTSPTVPADEPHLVPPIHAPALTSLGTHADATSPPLLAPSPPRSQPPPLRLVPVGSGRPRRSAVDERDGPRRGSGGTRSRGPARDPARVGPSARARGDLPRSDTGA